MMAGRQAEPAATVLVVDDDRTMCMLARQTLELAGFVVLEAGDGEQGLAVAAERRPSSLTTRPLDAHRPTAPKYLLCARPTRRSTSHANRSATSPKHFANHSPCSPDVRRLLVLQRRSEARADRRH